VTYLLLSGRPGAGKTHVGKWLAERRGFTHVETDTPAGLHTLNELLNGVQTAQGLVDNVVAEWGFKIEYFDAGLVRQFRDAGFDA
jgi:dephospho-CoA kinase